MNRLNTRWDVWRIALRCAAWIGLLYGAATASAAVPPRNPALTQAISAQLQAKPNKAGQWLIDQGATQVSVLATASQNSHLFVLLGGEVLNASHPTQGEAASAEFVQTEGRLSLLAISPWIEVGSFGKPQGDLDDPQYATPRLVQYGANGWAWMMFSGQMHMGYDTTWATLLAPRADDSAKLADFPVAAENSGAVGDGPELVNYQVKFGFKPESGQTYYPLTLRLTGHKGSKSIAPKQWQLRYDPQQKTYPTPPFLLKNLVF